jgi:hypothetical protein
MRALIETGLLRASFPADLPHEIGRIMGDDGDSDEP